MAGEGSVWISINWAEILNKMAMFKYFSQWNRILYFLRQFDFQLLSACSQATLLYDLVISSSRQHALNLFSTTFFYQNRLLLPDQHNNGSSFWSFVIGSKKMYSYLNDAQNVYYNWRNNSRVITPEPLREKNYIL